MRPMRNYGERHADESVKKMKTFALLLTLVAIFSIVSLDLLPVVGINWDDWDDGDEIDYFSNGSLPRYDSTIDDIMDWYFWTELALWIVLIFAFIAMFSVLFIQSGLHDRTGFIFSLIATGIVLGLFLSIIFLSLFIVSVVTEEKFDASYGYNYLPPLFIAGMVVISIFYVIRSIKFSKTYFRQYSTYHEGKYMYVDPAGWTDPYDQRGPPR